MQVIDFGSSCYEQQQIYTYIQSRYYRAPEVIMGARYTCAIDMWSLACVIGELFTSQPLFAGEDEHDQLATIMEVSCEDDQLATIMEVSSEEDHHEVLRTTSWPPTWR